MPKELYYPPGYSDCRERTEIATSVESTHRHGTACACENKTAFESFPKMPRLFREAVVTEKIDGTNAQIFIGECGEFLIGSRNRWITPLDDNFGFARWAHEHKEDLLRLGPGRHFGEWWGAGIQRRYGLTEKRFSLFNVGRWVSANLSPEGFPLHSLPGVVEGGTGERGPECCHVVPIIWSGTFNDDDAHLCCNILRARGSFAAPGFPNPEGIVIFHTAAKQCFKVTLENDESPKSQA